MSVPQTLHELVNPVDMSSRYDNLAKIGEGAAASIFSALDTATNEMVARRSFLWLGLMLLEVAIKKIERKPNNLKWLIAEIGIMKVLLQSFLSPPPQTLVQECNHPKIVAYYDSFVSGSHIWVTIPWPAFITKPC